MDIETLIAWTTEGLPADQATAVAAAIRRDSVKAKVTGLRQENEYAAIQARAAEAESLKIALDAVDPDGNPRGYRAWYNKFYKTIEANNKAIEAYDARYGAGAFQKTAAGEVASPTVTTPGVTSGLSKAEVQALLREEFTNNYAGNIATVVKGAGNLVQKHMFAGRKTPIPFDDLDKMMGEKKLTLEQAYDEWDKPERERAETVAREADIEKRVTERLQARQAGRNFPGGADLTPSTLTERSKADNEKFDKVDLRGSLAKLWVDQNTGVTQ